MSLLWYWRYIPCAGVKLEFDQFDLYEMDERTIVHLTRRDPKEKRKIFQKHIQEDDDRLFKQLQGIDFEIALASISGDGIFLLDYAHVFLFLLMIWTGGWVSVPVMLTHSTLEDPEVDAPHILCSHFIDTRPTYLGDFRLNLEDAPGSNPIWKRHFDLLTSQNFKMLCRPSHPFIAFHIRACAFW